MNFQTIFFFDLIDSVSADAPKIPQKFNQYRVRSIDIDMVTNHHVFYVFTKMCKVLLMTFLIPRKPKDFKGTRVYGHGTLKIPQHISFPGFAEFLRSKAEKLDLFDEKLSTKQKLAMARRFTKNKDKMLTSESQTAFEADQELQLIEKIRQRFIGMSHS